MQLAAWNPDTSVLILTHSCAPLPGKMTNNVERKLSIHSMLIHPHVVRFQECFLTDRHLANVMEYAAGGNLFTHVTARSAYLTTMLAARMPMCLPTSIRVQGT